MFMLFLAKNVLIRQITITLNFSLSQVTQGVGVPLFTKHFPSDLRLLHVIIIVKTVAFFLLVMSNKTLYFITHPLHSVDLGQ